MTEREAREAIDIIKSECYVMNLLNLDRTRMINSALDKAVEALEMQIDIDEVVERIKRMQEQDVLCKYPYGRCINEIKRSVTKQKVE